MTFHNAAPALRQYDIVADERDRALFLAGDTEEPDLHAVIRLGLHRCAKPGGLPI